MSNVVPLPSPEIDRALPITPQLYEYLRVRIVDNRLHPGAKISETALASTLQVSRTPLRAALQQLAKEGLVITRPQVGTLVAELDSRQMLEAVRIRAALETEVARRLAEMQADLTPLEPILAFQARTAELDDYATFFRQDEAFHAKLADLAEMPNAWRLVHSIKGHVDRQRYAMMSRIPMRSKRAYDEHIKIVERLRQGDAGGAADALRDHVQSVLELGDRDRTKGQADNPPADNKRTTHQQGGT